MFTHTHTFILTHTREFVILFGVACISGLILGVYTGNQSASHYILNAINILLIVFCMLFYFLKKISFKTLAGILLYSIIINLIISQLITPSTSQNMEFSFIRNNLIIIMFMPAVALMINRKHIFGVGLLIVVYYICSFSISHNQIILENLSMLIFLNISFILIIYYLIAQIEKSWVIQIEHNKKLISDNAALKENLASTSIFQEEKNENMKK